MNVLVNSDASTAVNMAEKNFGDGLKSKSFFFLLEIFFVVSTFHPDICNLFIFNKKSK